MDYVRAFIKQPKGATESVVAIRVLPPSTRRFKGTLRIVAGSLTGNPVKVMVDSTNYDSAVNTIMHLSWKTKQPHSVVWDRP